MWKWGIGIFLVVAVGLVILWRLSLQEYYISPELKREVLEVLDQAQDGELIMFSKPRGGDWNTLDGVDIIKRVEIDQPKIKSMWDAFAPPYYSNRLSVIMCFYPHHAIVLNLGEEKPIIVWVCLSCRRFRIGGTDFPDNPFPPPWFHFVEKMFLEAGFPLKPVPEK